MGALHGTREKSYHFKHLDPHQPVRNQYPVELSHCKRSLGGPPSPISAPVAAGASTPQTMRHSLKRARGGLEIQSETRRVFAPGDLCNLHRYLPSIRNISGVRHRFVGLLDGAHASIPIVGEAG